MTAPLQIHPPRELPRGIQQGHRDTLSLDLSSSNFACSTTNLFSSSQSLSIHDDFDLPHQVLDLPPTTNKLRPKEKAILLKKARKLSQVLGATLTFEALTPAITSTISIPGQALRSIDQDGFASQRGNRDHTLPQRAYQPLLPNALQVLLPSTAQTSRNSLQSLSAANAPMCSNPASRRPLLSIHLPPPSMGKASLPILSPSGCIMSCPSSPAQIRLPRIPGTPPDDLAATEEGHEATARLLSRSTSVDLTPLAYSSSVALPYLPLQRSQSLRCKNGSRLNKDLPLRKEFQQRYLPSFWEEFATANDNAHVSNVRRARKVAQIFGQEPPSELIASPRPGARRTTPCHTPSLPASPLPSIRYLEEVNATDDLSMKAESIAGDNYRLDDDDEFPSQLNTPKDLNGVHHRREVKLSRFFGVNYQDIQMDVSPVAAINPPASNPTTINAAVNEPNDENKQAAQKNVDIKIGRRSWRFWSFDEAEGQMKDANIGEVLQRLRDLKAD